MESITNLIWERKWIQNDIHLFEHRVFFEPVRLGWLFYSCTCISVSYMINGNGCKTEMTFNHVRYQARLVPYIWCLNGRWQTDKLVFKVILWVKIICKSKYKNKCRNPTDLISIQLTWRTMREDIPQISWNHSILKTCQSLNQNDNLLPKLDFWNVSIYYSAIFL